MSILPEIDAFLILNAIEGLGPARILQLVKHFGSAAAALCAPIQDLLAARILPGAVVEKFAAFPQARKPQIS